jgi:hypothetical protein
MKTVTVLPETPEDELGLDLWALISAVGVPVVELVQVTTIPVADGRRACFRVTFADGQVLKARRLRSPGDVERVTRLSSLLDPKIFPPVLAHHGCGLLTSWIPDGPIERSEWTSARLRACGRVHATLHRLPVPAGLAHLRRRPVDWEERFGQLLDELVDRRAFDSGRAREIHRLAAVAAPSPRSTCVCHTDFCGDNIIITDAGAVCVIDNEGIAVDAPEYDLARTWYRWPLTPSQQRAYGEGYGAHEHVAGFAAHFLHWAIMVLVESAAFRIRENAAGARIPLERLARLLRTHGRRDSFPRLLRRR